MANSDLIAAKALIDRATATRPPTEQFGQIANEVSMHLLSAMREVERGDEQAELAYEWARLDLLAMNYPPPLHDRSRLAHAKSQLQDAVRYSTRGSGQRLAFYEAELAKFQATYPDI